MTTVTRQYPLAKSKVAVNPIQWIPGALSATLPFFAISSPTSNTLCLRADDPNIYGVYAVGLQQSPVVSVNSITKPSNKGYNFYSAPWCIGTLPAQDLGKRIIITAIDSSVYQYITDLYGLLGGQVPPITLDNWRLEQEGYIKLYQLLQGSQFVNVGTSTYFGGQTAFPSAVNGVSEYVPLSVKSISNDFTYNGTNILNVYRMPYNTFCAVDSPIIISAVDSTNPATPRVYFTLLNGVAVYNGPVYPQ
jgi:hypothetical protein